MATCAHPKCGKRLIPVEREDGTWTDRHPTPQCDPDGLTDLTPAELVELEAKYFPPQPEPTGATR